MSKPIQDVVRNVTETIRAAELMLRSDDMFGCEELVVEQILADAKVSLQALVDSTKDDSNPIFLDLLQHVAATRATVYADVLLIYIRRKRN